MTPDVKLYRNFREAGKRLGNEIMRLIPSWIVKAEAKNLGMVAKGVLVFEDEDEMSVLLDRIVFDVPSGGKTIIAQYIKSKAQEELTDLEKELLSGMLRAWFSLFEVVSVYSRFSSLKLRDLLNPREEIRLIDLGISQTAEPGYLLATRLIPIRDWHMTSGIGFPFQPALKEQLLQGLKRPRLSSKDKRKFRIVAPQDYSRYFYTRFRNWSMVKVEYQD